MDKHVKDQVAIVLKGRCGYLKKKIEADEGRLCNYTKAHCTQLKEVLAHEENVAKVDRMTKVCGMQKTTQWVGHGSEIRLEERLVSINMTTKAAILLFFISMSLSNFCLLYNYNNLSCHLVR